MKDLSWDISMGSPKKGSDTLIGNNKGGTGV